MNTIDSQLIPKHLNVDQVAFPPFGQVFRLPSLVDDL